MFPKRDGWREMDRQPAHPFLVLLWLLTPTRSHSLPAMIRQKVCRTRGNGSSCPKPLTSFVVELKIRPEKEKYASPPPLPDWGLGLKGRYMIIQHKVQLLHIQMHRFSYCCRQTIDVLFWDLVYGRQKTLVVAITRLLVVTEGGDTSGCSTV